MENKEKNKSIESQTEERELTLIEKVCKQKGVNLTDVARAAGLEKSALFAIKYGRVEPRLMYYRTIHKVAKVLGVDVLDLVDTSEIDKDFIKDPPPKRGPGRPRKEVTDPPKPKRKVGRPRKRPLEDSKQKRGPGRPRKSDK